jgi:transposase
MSLKPQAIPPVPDNTATIARAAFPKGNTVVRLRDELGTLYQDDQFAALYPQRGQPAAAPWRLALVSVLQFLEGLPDRQAADAVRGRIDWKFALSLDLSDPGFDFSVLSEFRARRVEGGQEMLLLETLLVRLKEAGLVKARGQQRTDSTHVLAAIRGLNRLETVDETLRAALNSLAEVAPAWLTERITPDWFERYGRRVEEYRRPKGEAARTALAERIGRDGHQILAAVYAADAPAGLRALPTAQALRRTWVHQFYLEDERVRWRTAADLPPAGQRHDSPYDVEAHYGNKRSATWVGYKIHLTEIQQARRQQETEDWRQRYAARAGIEGTLAQALQLFGLRRCRYVGLAKTRLQHVLTAVALNIVRLEAWWTGRPLAKTRVSRFVALQLAAA